MEHLALFLLLAQEPQAFQLVGRAEMVGDRLRLTPSKGDSVGAAWFPQKQPVSAGFDVSFRFQLTDQQGLGPGADGFAFVLQSEGTRAMAGRGASGGFALGDGQGNKKKPGIPRSLAVFFDTFHNGDADDPSDNYIAICTNGPVGKMKWPPSRLGIVDNPGVRMKDGRPHSVRIRYRPPVLSVFLDSDDPVLQLPVDVRTVTDETGSAYAGFTASTGGGYQNHDIFDWRFQPEVTSELYTVSSDIQYFTMGCVDGKNLCTPPEAVVEERGPGLYHVVLPAHLEWGAHIPNPAGTGVIISGAHGSACWGPVSEPAQNCGGPSGVAAESPDALLSPALPAGAIVIKTERGRTWFTLNSRKDRSPRINQGYYEFDVRIQ